MATSERKRAANRANGRASRGPKTVKGKARSSQNARRHGLTLAVLIDPALSKELEELAQEIAGGGANQGLLEHARAVAEAQIDLVRIRRARQDLLVRKKMGVTPESGARADLVEVGEGALPPAPEWPVLTDRNSLNAIPVLSEVLDQLAKIDRYERRTLSRRKFAIRRFDAARKELEPAANSTEQENKSIK